MMENMDDMAIPGTGEQADLGLPVDQETVDRVIENVPDDIVDVIEGNEDGFYPSSQSLMTYARLRGKNPTDQELKEFLDTTEGQEFLDREQLVFYGEQFTNGLNNPEDDIEEAFKVIDTNEDKTVDIKELSFDPIITVGIVHDGMDNKYGVYGQNLPRFRSFLSGKGANPLNDEELDELFANFDTNEDGKLNLDELKSLFLKPMDL